MFWNLSIETMKLLRMYIFVEVIDDDLSLSCAFSFFPSPKVSFLFQVFFFTININKYPEIYQLIWWNFYIYILERSHRWWSFISSSFFLSLTQDFLSFPSYLFTIDIKISINKCFGIYQLKGWSFIFSSFFFSKVPFDIKIESLLISFGMYESMKLLHTYIRHKNLY